MKARWMTALLAMTTLVLLTGLYSGCNRRDLSPAEVAAWIEERVVSRVEDILDGVDASETQQRLVVAATQRVVRETVALRGVSGEGRQLLLGEWKADRPDAERMHRLIDRRIDDLRRVMHVAADAFVEVHQTLTPKQRAEVLDEL